MTKSNSLFALVLISLIGMVCAVCTDTCVLDPEVTEGPYYVDLQLVRSDIREGKDGIPLYLNVTVVDSNSCSVVPDAGVQIWQCDAEGLYSYYEAKEGVQNPPENTTFLRGVQLSGEDGRVNFISVFPGWYEGRAVHIHMKVHQNGTDGMVVHTGQLFFEEELIEQVAKVAPYSTSTVNRVTNPSDNIYDNGGYYGLVSNWEFVNQYDITQGIMASVAVEVNAEATSTPVYYMPGGGSGGPSGQPPSGQPPSGQPPSGSSFFRGRQ